MRMLACLTAAAAVAAGAVGAAPAERPMKGAEFAPQAKVTLAKARADALAARPGVITDQELEREAGGSGLRYSFDIKDGAKTFEVGIDAKTGKLLENKAEGANPD